MSFYNEFFTDKPDLEQTFKEFGVRFNIPVERKLKAIKERDEFLAAIIEFRFGVFFASLFPKVEHEKKAFPDSALTPDWTVTSGVETIIAEVVRLNPSKGDSQEMDFSNVLMDCVQSIPGDYILQLDYEFVDIQNLSIDLEQVKSKIAQWLEETREIGDHITLYDHITIEVIHKNNGKQHVLVIGNFSTINFDYRRLSGENSRLFSKLKYAESVERNGLPFIICIYLTFESWFKPEDVYEKLYGLSGIFHHDKPFNEYYPNAPFHNIMEGLYYSNERLKNSVSGVLVRYQNEYFFFPNYYVKNRLSKESMRILSEVLYKDLKF